VTDDRPRPRLRLPETLRDAFKEPLGPVYTDPRALLADAGDPLVAVGDVVTHHLHEAGRRPAVAVVDGRTERQAVDETVAATLAEAGADPAGRRVSVVNDPGCLSGDLLAALVDAVDAADGGAPVTIHVDGEEDLTTLPALLVTPVGGCVVYGQPGEGMVRVDVTPEVRAEAAALLARMDGDVEAAFDVLGVDPPASDGAADAGDT
jgi:uncharacterized protein (UPF0218 family)